MVVPKNLENWHNSNANRNSFVQKGNKFLPAQPTVFKAAKNDEINKIRASNLRQAQTTMAAAYKERPQ